jgi:hypothetical protein
MGEDVRIRLEDGSWVPLPGLPAKQWAKEVESYWHAHRTGDQDAPAPPQDHRPLPMARASLHRPVSAALRLVAVTSPLGGSGAGFEGPDPARGRGGSAGHGVGVSVAEVDGQGVEASAVFLSGIPLRDAIDEPTTLVASPDAVRLPGQPVYAGTGRRRPPPSHGVGKRLVPTPHREAFRLPTRPGRGTPPA